MLLYIVLLLFFFFFKQKTAYEMRISDWSSDVCSSDLGAARWISCLDFRVSGRTSSPPSCHFAARHGPRSGGASFRYVSCDAFRSCGSDGCRSRFYALHPYGSLRGKVLGDMRDLLGA